MLEKNLLSLWKLATLSLFRVQVKNSYKQIIMLQRKPLRMENHLLRKQTINLSLNYQQINKLLELPQTQNKLQNTMANIITKIKVRLQKIQLFYLLIMVHSYNQLLEVLTMRHTKMCLLRGWVNSFLIILICLGQTLTWQVRDFLQQDQDSHLQV